MRRIFPSVSVVSARAILVSAAILAGTSFFPAGASYARSVSSTPDNANDEVSFAEVRSSLGGEEVAFPRPLSAENVKRYRAIFHALREGDLQKAAQYTALLKDKILLSDVLAETYLRSEAHPTILQLHQWLKEYPSSPDVPAIEMLLRTLDSAYAMNAPLHKGSTPILKRGDDASDFMNMKNSLSLAKVFTRNIALERKVQEMVSHGVKGGYSALALIEHSEGINPAYKSHLYGDVALGLLSQGCGRDALRIGTKAFELDKKKVGFPAFVAGLSAWHEGNMEAAYFLFESAANSTIIEGDIQAAAAFWAARVQSRRHKTHESMIWLHRAALHHQSFYGLLAQESLKNGGVEETHLQRLGSDVVLTSHNLYSLGEVDIEAVMMMEQGRHLFALLQIGEQGRAEALMRRIWPDTLSDLARARSLQLVAKAAGMTDLSLQMREILDQLNHQNLKENIGQLPHLQPQKGFHIDPALVYAVAHVESNFNPDAASSVGAVGMMQIRPGTANFITTKHVNFDEHGAAIFHIPADMTHRLCDPAYNLEVGQLYLLYLADAVSKSDGSEIGHTGDLLRVLASYNAGPQAIIRWETLQNGQHDPLYFVETLPNVETRQYVHKVMTSTWLYAHHMGLGAPSLTSLAHARWPSFSQEKYVEGSPS